MSIIKKLANSIHFNNKAYCRKISKIIATAILSASTLTSAIMVHNCKKNVTYTPSNTEIFLELINRNTKSADAVALEMLVNNKVNMNKLDIIDLEKTIEMQGKKSKENVYDPKVWNFGNSSRGYDYMIPYSDVKHDTHSSKLDLGEKIKLIDKDIIFSEKYHSLFKIINKDRTINAMWLNNLQIDDALSSKDTVYLLTKNNLSIDTEGKVSILETDNHNLLAINRKEVITENIIHTKVLFSELEDACIKRVEGTDTYILFSSKNTPKIFYHSKKDIAEEKYNIIKSIIEKNADINCKIDNEPKLSYKEGILFVSKNNGSYGCMTAYSRDSLINSINKAKLQLRFFTNIYDYRADVLTDKKPYDIRIELLKNSGFGNQIRLYNNKKIISKVDTYADKLSEIDNIDNIMNTLAEYNQNN